MLLLTLDVYGTVIICIALLYGRITVTISRQKL